MFCLFWELLQTPWVVAHSYIAAFCWVYFPWVPLFQSHMVPSGNSTEFGSELKQDCCPTSPFADSGLGCKKQLEKLGTLSSSPGSFPWFASCRSGQDKGEAAGAAWEHLLCAPDFNRSAKLPEPGFSLCCLEGLENADVSRAGRKWAGFVILQPEVYFAWSCSGSSQWLSAGWVTQKWLLNRNKFSSGEVSLCVWASFFSHLHPPFWGVTLLSSLELFWTPLNVSKIRSSSCIFKCSSACLVTAKYQAYS